MRRLQEHLRNSTAMTVALVSTPAAAMACPLCYSSFAPRVLQAYYISAALLSIMPFAVVAVLVLIGVRTVRRARESERAAQREPV